jgi:hypothetical protein
MATLRQKIAAERKVRELLATEDVPAPDRIEYGFIRLFWLEPKVVLVVDIDEFTENDPENVGSRRIDVFPPNT